MEKITEFKKLDTNELKELYEIISFMAPYVLVKRKSDGRTGTMLFSHRPRYYYNFELEKKK